MKNLLEIAAVVTKKKVKKIEIFDEYSLRNKAANSMNFTMTSPRGSTRTTGTQQRSCTVVARKMPVIGS